MNDYSRFSDSSTVFVTNSHKQLSDSPAIREGGNQSKHFTPGPFPTSQLVMNAPSANAPENHHITPIFKVS